MTKRKNCAAGCVAFFFAICCINVVQASKQCNVERRLKPGEGASVAQSFMNCWGQDVEHGMSDLVVLIDNSGSMYRSGFQAAKEFVSSLLSEVRVAFNATRIAVVTFSTHRKTEINYLWTPDAGNHKCKFVQDFKKVQYVGHMTNLRGALSDAHDIFGKLISEPIKNLYRSNANKAIMLLSDGKGNTLEDGSVNWFEGNNVLGQLKKIEKFQTVEIYTVAVTPGVDANQLQNVIATDPSLYMYQPTFDKLKDIARLIRGDPYEHDYELSAVLSSDCTEGCDINAYCGCNLMSGNYKCACKRGYFGTGDKRTSGNSCAECPVNTYGNKIGLVTECVKCPENSGTNGKKKQFYVSDCHCNIGYEGNPSINLPCTKKTCSPVYNVNFGFVANPAECNKKEFGAKCIFRCNANYKLVGNDVVQCDENKRWSGSRPICMPLRCSGADVTDTTTYTVDCVGQQDRNSLDYDYGSYCNFTCKDTYYHDSGDKQRHCLRTEKWSGSAMQCKEIACPKIVKVHEKLTTVDPNADCFNNTLKVGQKCEFTCTSSFQTMGSKVLTCKKASGAVGRWEAPNGFTAPNCSDVTRPSFSDNNRCFNGIPLKNNTVQGQSYGLINFEAIGVTDNSGGPIVVRSDPPGSELGRTYRFPITTTTTQVTFIASDPSGNTRNCRFLIDIYDKEKPKMLSCPDDIEITTSEETVKVNWTIPTYSDNCGTYEQCPLTISSNYYPLSSNFKLGEKTEVRYTAKDPSDNENIDCIFIVDVKTPSCTRLPAPRNGMMVVFGTSVAKPSCQSGFYPTTAFPYFYSCRNNGWTTFPPSAPPVVVPDCIETTPPTGMDLSMYFFYTYNGDCSSTAAQEEAKGKLVQIGFCTGDCAIDKLEAYCGATTVVNRRKRSTSRSFSFKVTIKVTTTKEQAKQDPDATQLKNSMLSTVAPSVLTNVNNVNDWNTKVDSNIQSLDQAYYNNADVKKTCAELGTTFNENSPQQQQCAPCPAGEFKNLTTGTCQKCSPGTFQPKEGSTSCTPCPHGSTTVTNDMKNETSCRKICQPGEYSENGLSPCTASPPGTYTEGERQTSSTPCPTGTTTVIPGASSRFQCGTKCEPGTFSSNGVEPCSPCEQGSYQSNRGQLTCIDCPGLTWTYGEGADSLSACTDIDSCASNPCLSNGHCIDLKVGFRCECRPGFWGKRCEKEVNDCWLKPCLNGGHCLDKFGGYLCVCPAGTIGKNCETLNGRCNTGVCGSHGDCTDLADNSFKCVCHVGYTGEFCESFVDPCQSEPCKNAGICTTSVTDFSCQCKPGFTGKTCESNLNFCASQPCKNGGECTDGTNGFTCRCPSPYHGVSCEFKTNMCQHTVCKHSVGCTDLGTDVKCSCKPGYGGKLCDKKLGNDFDIGFQTRQSPSFSFVEGKFDITQFTVAFWMRSSDTLNKGTPISYANKDKGKINDNALVLSDYGDFELTINNISVALNFDANDGEWHHIAVTWSNSNGIWVAYKDGSEIKRATTTFQRGQTIRKGGIFVIGEEQDEIGGAFTRTESFFGDMSQLNIWRRVLSANEIYDLTMSCKHAAGDVLAWGDFSEQEHGSIIKSTTSIACDFSGSQREYQLLRGWQLPPNLRSVISTASNVNAKACAQKCSSGNLAHKCRAFIHNKNTNVCTFYSKSLITHEDQEPEKAVQYDLYQWSCVKALGLEENIIPNSKIIASSSKTGTQPYMARLHNVPASSTASFAHWSPTNQYSFWQVDLVNRFKITGIATQGHWDENADEFATKYFIYYFSSSWTIYVRPGGSYYLPANTNSKDIVRNEVFFYAKIIRIYPKRFTGSGNIAMRIEIYGCPSRPQGQPQIKNDGNQCAASPCKNGGQCVDLYQRYACICPTGLTGSQCQTAKPCPNPDVPVYGQLVSRTSTEAKVKCNAGYTLIGSATRYCVKGTWSGSTPRCDSTNECAAGTCSHGCEDLDGGYRCFCPKGYNLATDGKTCQDINECQIQNGGCSHSCQNSPGDYRCSCRAGYKLSGKLLCVDIDECQGNHQCSQDCDNTLGSYQCSCRTGYTLKSDGKSCDQTNCPYVPNIANGQVTRTTLKVSYSCNSGHKISGSTVRECHPDGQWSGVQPTCTRVTCTNLKGETAIVTVSGNSYGSVARFSCRSSYRLFGSSSRTCSQSGEWSNTQPRCARSSCPVLQNPLHGKILGLGSSVGSVVRVKCNMGYRLVQSNLELRTCQSNGQWTGGNTATMTCQVIDCGRPASSPSLVITLHGNTYYQARVTYSCSQSGGQRCLDGPSTRYCNADGQWSGKQPTCIANSCCKPSLTGHSTLYSDNSYNYGDKVYTKCDVGYVTGGSALRTCQNNGQWSGTQTTCTIQNCGDPGTVTNGIRLMSSTTYQSTARYFCNPGYTLRGSGNRVCQADGTWSGQATSCILSNCGGRKLAQSGTIVSNDGRKECHWLIRVTEGKKVSLRFNSFNPGPNDQLKIFDGEKYDEFVTFTNASRPRALTGNTHLMRVIYIGGENPGNGFSLSFKEANCGGLLDSENGVITSPGFPNSYKANDECFWTIFRPSQRLQLSFETFQLFENPKDFVEVFEGPFENSRILLYKTFGIRKPVVERSYRWLWVHFQADNLYHSKGFKAYYKIYQPRN
eukprot:gene6970-7755_t